MARSKMKKIRDVPAEAIRAALYIRVSTDRQAEEGYSIEVQTERLEAYTKTFDGDVQYELYIDDGFSGASLERPAMQRLIADAENGVVTHVLVLKLDRLSRSQKDTLHLIEDVFLPHNVAFVSVQESFNTATAFGRAVVGILSVFAQLERENIYERTRSGMQKRVEAGYWPGGGGVPFGYDYDPEKGILVPNADAGTVRQIYELYLQGYALQTIANLLGLKYEKLAAQILLRKTNIGIIEYNGVEYKGLHEPIVSRETYEKAMKLHALRSAARLTVPARHLLTGLLWCGVCGARLRYQKWGQAGYKLVCYSQQISKPYLVRDPDCDNETIWAEDVEAAVAHDLLAMTADDVGAADAAVSVTETLQRKKAALEAKLRRLYGLYGDAGDRVLLESIGETRAALAALEEKLAAETTRGSLSRDAAAAREQLRSLRGTWPYMDAGEKRALVVSVIEKITVTHGEVTIDYRF